MTTTVTATKTTKTTTTVERHLFARTSEKSINLKHAFVRLFYGHRANKSVATATTTANSNCNNNNNCNINYKKNNKNTNNVENFKSAVAC